MSSRVLTIAAVFALSVGLTTVPALAEDTTYVPSSEISMGTKLTKRLNNKAIGNDLAYVVMDAQSQRIVATKNSDKPMLPASNMKIITATNALSTMAPTKTFTTAVFPELTPGRVVLQGGGDPLLTKKNLKALAAKVAAEVDHSQALIVDNDLNLFSEPTNGPGWTKGYIPSVVSPVTPLGIYGDYSHNPTDNAINAFISELNRLGIQTSRGVVLDVAADSVPLASINPHTVADAVHSMLLDSENNIAEILFRHVAIATSHPATWQGAAEAALANLNALGLDTANLHLADGSGVSRADRLTAISLANVLRLVSTTDPARFSVMFEPGSMPTSGVDGTLKAKFHRYSTTPSSCAKGNIRAKTGTLHDTITLSGTTHDADGQLKVFSFLVNNRPTQVIPLRTRQAIDGLAATITGCW
jgi:serine-type D-Ala-D-Ala carboxypeptidase/endopeptidase (penicillin-binding protein 4)